MMILVKLVAKCCAKQLYNMQNPVLEEEAREIIAKLVHQEDPKGASLCSDAAFRRRIPTLLEDCSRLRHAVRREVWTLAGYE